MKNSENLKGKNSSYRVVRKAENNYTDADVKLTHQAFSEAKKSTFKEDFLGLRWEACGGHFYFKYVPAKNGLIKETKTINTKIRGFDMEFFENQTFEI